jgi:hypothetical protein
MRKLVLFSCAFIAAGSIAAAASLPIRPALLGKGPASLINVLSSERLVKHGQKDGLVSFTLFVNHWGNPVDLLTYGGSEDSGPLARELVDQFQRSKLVPALFHGEPVGAMIDGTLAFAISADGKPHLRIFLHQDRERLAHGDDFIAPQLLFPINTKFKWFDFSEYRLRSGMVAVQIKVDENGKLLESNVLREYPPGAGFGKYVMRRIGDADVSPPFLNDQAVTSTTVWMIPFRDYFAPQHWIN